MLALANAALRDAIATLAPDQHPLVHSDQVFQYQHLPATQSHRNVATMLTIEPAPAPFRSPK